MSDTARSQEIDTICLRLLDGDVRRTDVALIKKTATGYDFYAAQLAKLREDFAEVESGLESQVAKMKELIAVDTEYFVAMRNHALKKVAGKVTEADHAELNRLWEKRLELAAALAE